MSTKLSSRPRKQRQKDEMKQEIVAQVHKTVKRDASSDRENINKTENTEDSSESNKTFILEDQNENYNRQTPNREISVDGETQISSKIINLIETEMKRDINKHSHFTDSRPQSLSFYEDEKIPEELSGNLELLSPEERKHYKRRKEYTDIDLERNAYNSMQDTLSRENEDINGTMKKSKSRKKKHTGESEIGLGDSREMMIPKEKRKSKKKKREYSPLSSNSTKRKHRKRDEDFEPKNEITLALEELQDDVFENGTEDFARPDKMKKSPRKSDKVYVQKKNKFEVSSRNLNSSKMSIPPDENFSKGFSEYSALDLAVEYQKLWMPFATLCHGLLGGLALAHCFYLCTNYRFIDTEFIIHYANYSDLYVCLFFLLNVICLVSVFDRYDLSHINMQHLRDLFHYKKSSLVIIIYGACFTVHLVTARLDDKMGVVALNNETATNLTRSDIDHWYNLCIWRSSLAGIGWIFVALAPTGDMFYLHLKSMEKYATTSSN